MKNSKIFLALILVLATVCAVNAQKSAKIKYVEYDDLGNVPIATTGTGSKLAVGGIIESTNGGIKFPDGSMQTTAGLTQIVTAAPLSGNGTASSPLTLQTSTASDPDASRQPFNKRILSNVGQTGATLETVPAGKILVIEFLTGYTGTVDSVPNTLLELTINGTLAAYISPRNYFNTSPGFRLWNYAEPLKLRLTSGQVLAVSFYSGGENLVLLNGYYVNAP